MFYEKNLWFCRWRLSVSREGPVHNPEAPLGHLDDVTVDTQVPMTVPRELSHASNDSRIASRITSRTIRTVCMHVNVVTHLGRQDR
eukprot:scaffold97255_cov49-Attheya_sp.AAC.1